MSSGHQTGLDAEDEAARFLNAQGFAVLDRRWKCKDGELDLVVASKGLIVFVEVKARADQSAGQAALERLGADHARLMAAAEQWIAAHSEACEGRDMRFDVVLIVPGAPITHVENAFV